MQDGNWLFLKLLVTEENAKALVYEAMEELKR